MASASSSSSKPATKKRKSSDDDDAPKNVKGIPPPTKALMDMAGIRLSLSLAQDDLHLADANGWQLRNSNNLASFRYKVRERVAHGEPVGDWVAISVWVNRVGAANTWYRGVWTDRKSFMQITWNKELEKYGEGRWFPSGAVVGDMSYHGDIDEEELPDFIQVPENQIGNPTHAIHFQLKNDLSHYKDLAYQAADEDDDYYADPEVNGIDGVSWREAMEMVIKVMCKHITFIA